MKNPSLNGSTLTRQLLQQNAILRELGESETAMILKQGDLINLSLRQKIYEPEQPIREVYFPLDCVLSVVTHNERRQPN